MQDLNSVMVEGRLTRDPEIKYTGKGTAVCNLSIANNRRWKEGQEEKEETSFFDIVAWGRQAETCGEYLEKGRGVRVFGRMQQQRWESDGQKRNKIVINADHVEFMPKRERTSE